MNSRKISHNEARSWLRDAKQKSIQLDRVQALAKDMANGQWDIRNIPNDPIRIKDGSVEDGHHRLFAVLLSGKSVELKVAEA